MILLNPKRLSREYPDERARGRSCPARSTSSRRRGGGGSRRTITTGSGTTTSSSSKDEKLFATLLTPPSTETRNRVGIRGGTAISTRSSGSTDWTTGTPGRSRALGLGPIGMSANEEAKRTPPNARGGCDVRLWAVGERARRRYLLHGDDADPTRTAPTWRTATSTTSATRTWLLSCRPSARWRTPATTCSSWSTRRAQVRAAGQRRPLRPTSRSTRCTTTR